MYICIYVYIYIYIYNELYIYAPLCDGVNDHGRGAYVACCLALHNIYIYIIFLYCIYIEYTEVHVYHNAVLYHVQSFTYSNIYIYIYIYSPLVQVEDSHGRAVDHCLTTV